MAANYQPRNHVCVLGERLAVKRNHTCKTKGIKSCIEVWGFENYLASVVICKAFVMSDGETKSRPHETRFPAAILSFFLVSTGSVARFLSSRSDWFFKTSKCKFKKKIILRFPTWKLELGSDENVECLLITFRLEINTSVYKF